MALNVVFHGDSITLSSGGAANTRFSSLVSTALGIAEINEGYSSYTLNFPYVGDTGELYPNFDAHVHVHYSEGDDNIVVLQEITNSLIHGQTSETYISNFALYCAYARDKGWKVVVCNCMQFGVETSVPSLEDARVRIAAVNDWLSKNWNSVCHGLADINGSSVYAYTEFTGVGNPAFFVDQVHPNVDGHALLAPIIQAAVTYASNVSDSYEVILPGNLSRIVSLSGTRASTIYNGTVPYTYTLRGGVATNIKTTRKMVGYVSGGS